MARELPTKGLDGMIATVARMTLRDGSEVVEQCSFFPTAWNRLTLFANYADELVRAKLLSGEWKFGYSVVVNEYGTLIDATNFPDADQFNSLLMYMRPFILQRESTHFGKVKNDLAHVIKHEAFQRYFDDLSRPFHGTNPAMRLISAGKVINSSEVMKLWLDGYVYRRDAAKRLEFEALHDGEDMPLDVTTALHIGMILDAVQAVLQLRQFVRMLQKTANEKG